MKKLLSIFYISIIVIVAAYADNVYAQSRERRVYYLDCSYSMVSPNKIWKDVCDNLIFAIDAVNDETTELIVIPFAFDNQHHSILTAYSEKATAKGKDNLKKIIKSIKPNTNTMTYHSDPLNDFYSNSRVDNNCITYMFLMTDGQNEEQPDKFTPLLKQWKDKYSNSNVYGFYVMLHSSAKDNAVDAVIKDQEHLWKVETADVNINLIRLQSDVIFNAKNEKYLDVPVFGDLKDMKLDAQFVSDSHYMVNKVEQKNGFIRIWIDPIKGANIPVSFNTKLKTELKCGGKFDFLVTDNISVRCDYKPERSLKITVR